MALPQSMKFSEQGVLNLQTSTVEQSIEIIRRRLDPDGTKEPIIHAKALAVCYSTSGC